MTDIEICLVYKSTSWIFLIRLAKLIKDLFLWVLSYSSLQVSDYFIKIKRKIGR